MELGGLLMAEKKKDNRNRNWTFVVYPESAPQDWYKILQDKKLSFAVSPIHDSDIDDATGELKKAHYHVLLCFKGNKSYEQIKEITDELNCPIPQQVANCQGMIRYFIHKDHSDKAQYNIEDIRVHGDVDIVSPFQTAISRYEAISEMLVYIVENDIREFSTLLLHARLKNQEWFRLLCDNSSYVISQFIKSRRHQASDEREKEKELLY